MFGGTFVQVICFYVFFVYLDPFQPQKTVKVYVKVLVSGLEMAGEMDTTRRLQKMVIFKGLDQQKWGLVMGISPLVIC